MDHHPRITHSLHATPLDCGLRAFCRSDFIEDSFLHDCSYTVVKDSNDG